MNQITVPLPPESSFRPGGIVKEKEFWLLVALTILYFYQPLLGGQTFFFRDLYLFYYPQHYRLVEMLRAGQLPLWDPNLHGGQPFLGHVLNLVLYPTTLLYLVLPRIVAFNVEIVFHILLCAAGAYVLARSLRLSPASAFIAGVSYAFCGYTLSCVNLFVRLLALPYIPLLMLFWHLFLLEGKRRWFLISVLCEAVFILTGAIETMAMAFLFLMGWLLVYRYKMPRGRRIAYFALFLLFGAGISAIQIVPTAETVAQSTRSAGYSYPIFSAWSLNPWRLPEFILPGFFGSTNGIKESDYWGIQLEGYSPYILSVYFGLFVLFLAIRGIFSNMDSPHFPRRASLYLASAALLGVVFSFGDRLPFFYFLYSRLPGIDRFRYPLKLLTAGLLPLSLLAARGCELDFCLERKNATQRIFVFWIIAVLLSCFTVYFAFADRFATGLLAFYFKNPGPAARAGITRSLFHASAIWLLATLLYHARSRSFGRWQQAAVAAVIAFDLFWAGVNVNHFAPQQFLTGVPALAETVRAEIGDGRFLRMPNPGRMGFYLPGDDVSYMHRWNMETLENYTAAFYGIPLIFHENFDGVAKKEVARLAEALHKLNWNQRLTLFSASAIRLVLSPEKLTVPGLRFVAIVRNSSNTDFYLYRCENSPRNVFVSSWIAVESNEEALQHFMKADFDPERQVILVGGKGSAEKTCPGPAVEASYLSNTLARYSLKNECPGYLVFSEPYYPGWRVFVDGKSADLVKANYAFSAVYLPAGRHDVERKYRPASLLYGAGVSVLSGLALTFFLMKRPNEKL